LVRYVGLDISTKTGLCILDVDGNVLDSRELLTQDLGDPQRMMDLSERILKFLNPETDKVIIEHFAYSGKGQGVSFQYGAGYIVREMLINNNIPYTEVAPTSLKKFASNNGQAKKDALVLPIYKKWGFEHDSDNVRDAFVLSRMGWSMYNHDNLLAYEKEVLKKITKI